MLECWHEDRSLVGGSIVRRRLWQEHFIFESPGGNKLK